MDDRIIEQAMRWHAATTRNDCDWQQFTAWLEASPQHRRAYDDIALLEESIARHRPALAGAGRAVTAGGAPGARLGWWGAAVAAGFALVAVFVSRPAFFFGADQTESYVADAGAQRSLSLAGGVQVMLAPGSAIEVSGARSERIRLEGSAYFDVQHDPGRELVISAGPYQVRDIGTRFEVVANDGQLKVGVTEGRVGVLLPGRAEPVPVEAGRRLLVAGDPIIAEYSEVGADEVAGWREGRLVFRNEPLSMVASQLARHAGLTVTVDPSIAQRRFSGVLAVGDGSGLLDQLAQIMGLAEQREGAVVHLAAADGAAAGR